MKEKQELVLDFMLALAGNSDITKGCTESYTESEHILKIARQCASKYIDWYVDYMQGRTE